MTEKLETSSLKRRGVLSRLLRDQTGNILGITAASVIPMIGVVGGAIDISRIYLAQSRLQAACDAGVLAGRKAMGTKVYTGAARHRAEAMFNFNFQDIDYGTTNTSFTSSADNDGRLSGTASTEIPMALMQVFGFTEKDITVRCSADIQVPNIDIVFVLDVTGSMDDAISGTKKIDSLKTATKGFYDTIATALAGNTRSQVRYGFVPYSQAVNVSELFVASPDTSIGQAPLSHLANNMVVESRVANFNTGVQTGWVQDPNATPNSFTQIFKQTVLDSWRPDVAVTGNSNATKISNNDCGNYGNNYAFNVIGINLNAFFPMRTTFPGEGNGDNVLFKAEGSSTWQANEPTTGNFYTKATFARESGTWNDNNGATTGNYQRCTRRVTHTRFVKSGGYKFTNWTYKPVTFNVSQYKTGTALQYVSAVDPNYTVPAATAYDPVQLRALPIQAGLTSASATWNKCIEERATTAASNFSPIPDAATDLDYKTGGTSDSLRWRPVLTALTYDRGTSAEVNTTGNYGTPGTACPAASIRNLRTYTKTQFDSYVNTLSPNGYTYLDVGMVWGLRLISPQGMWGNRNRTGPNGGQIARHIIFLTDGEPVSAGDTYSAYGVERMSKRITGTTGVAAATLHSRRFQALCDAERGAVSIWAVAFGTSVTGNMSNCADPGRAMQANNTAQLSSAFNRIANEVADLRLVQ